MIVLVLLSLAVAVGALLYARHLDGELHKVRLKANAGHATAAGAERTITESARRIYGEIDGLRLALARRNGAPPPVEQTRLMPVVPEKG